MRNIYLLLLRWIAVFIGSFLLATALQAQVSRTTINPSFELFLPGCTPPAAPGNSFGILADVNAGAGVACVAGWDSTDTGGACVAGQFSGAGATCAKGVNVIEIWTDGFLNERTPTGKYYAELNAWQPGTLSQQICFIGGESVGWTLKHRFRDDPPANSGTDTMVVGIGVPGGTSVVGTLSSPKISANNYAVGSCVPGPGSTCNPVTLGSVTAPNAWNTFSGTYTPASTQVGLWMRATNPGSGGNHLDDISFTVKPLLELTATGVVTAGGIALSSRESSAAKTVSLIVVGTFAANASIVLDFGPGTAIGAATTAAPGTDFDFLGAKLNVANGGVTGGNNYGPLVLSAVSGSSATFVVPAGIYDPSLGNTVFTIGYRTFNNTLVQNNRIVKMALRPPLAADPYLLTSNTAVCGNAANTTVTYTLIDDDVDVGTSKTISGGNAATTLGGTVQFTVKFFNNSQNVQTTTVAPFDAHNGIFAIADAQPANLTFTSWTCAAGVGSACPAASGAGSIAATAQIADGSTLTYIINAQLIANPGACPFTATNTSTISAAGATSPGNSNDNAVLVEGSNSVAANTATAVIQALCPTVLSVAKTNATNSLVAGATTSYTVTFANTGVWPANNSLVSDSASSGLSCTSVTCAQLLGGAACPAGLTFGVPTAAGATSFFTTGTLLPTFPANSSVTLAVNCGVTATGQ